MFWIGLVAGGTIVYLFPGLGTGGNVLFKRFIKPALDKIFNFKF